MNERIRLVELHEEDAFFEDTDIIGRTFVWSNNRAASPCPGFEKGSFKTADGEWFYFYAARFEALP